MENMNIRATQTDNIQALGDEVLLASGKIGIEQINFTSDVGNTYQGEVRFKKPNVGDMLKMSGLKTAYIQSQFVDEKGTPIQVAPELIDDTLLRFAEVIATLKVVVIACPKWLMDLEEVEDFDLLFHVFGRYNAWRNSFRTKSKEQPKGTGAATEA